MKIYEQYKVEELFPPIFFYEKKILEGGKIVYVEIDRTPPTTGIQAMDDFLKILEQGITDSDSIAMNMEVKKSDLSGLVNLLTGKNIRDFVKAYCLHKIDLYLRYTNLMGKNLAKRCNMGSLTNITQQMQIVHGQSIRQRRQYLRKPGDVGKYLLHPPTEAQKNKEIM